jgi:hypothetical protein
MVLMMVSWKAGFRERWPKTFKEELENNSRNPRDLVGKLAQRTPKESSTYSFCTIVQLV